MMKKPARPCKKMMRAAVHFLPFKIKIMKRCYDLFALRMQTWTIFIRILLIRTLESRDMEDLQSQLPTRWLELDSPGKLQALDNSGLKTYILKAESIRPFLGRVGHLVGEFWENFKSGRSTVLGHSILVMQQDIFRATGLPNKGCTVGYWFENRDYIVKRIGKEAWNAEHAMRLKQLCGVLTNFKHDFPVDMIKDGTTRYVASLVMEHLSGWCTVSDCSYGFLDAIEQGMKREITNWCAHIAKRMKVVGRKAVTARTEGTQKEFRYAVVIALLVREQAPDLWQHVAESEGWDLELLKKRGRNKINGVQDIGLLKKKRRMNKINGVQGREMLKERRMKEINGNGFELKNMKAERKVEGSEGDRYGEKRPMLSVALVDLEQEVGIEDTEGLQMQGKVESKQDSLGYQGAGAVLQRMKVGLAEECAETAEQYLADREAWMEASVQEVPDAELLDQYYSDLTFGSGDHVWENWMHFKSMSQWRRFSGFAELEQRERKKGRRTREYDKMLVVSVEYILAHFVHKSKVPFAHGDLYVDPYIVFVHPQACRFLWACLSVFKVVLWSEKPREVHDLVLQHILGCTTISGRILSYSIEDCIIMRITLKGNAVHGCCKDLTRVWDDLGDYDNVNTLLIDTSPVTMLRNQDGNVICPIPYQYHVQASHWQLEAYLLPYLECLESVQCIPEFVKNFPFCLEKGHAWERSQFEEGRVTPLFGTPFPPCRHRIVKYWQLFPSIVTETSNSQLDLFNTQCPGINNTGKQLPITRTSISFSQSVPPTANLGIFEMYHGISSGEFLGFSDYIRSNNNMKYTMELIKQSDDKMKFKRELIRRARDDIKYTRELNQAKADLHNMAYEKNKLEKKLQEVEDAWEKSHEEKIKAEKKNTNLSKAFVERGRILKKMDLDKNRELKKSENIICSLQNTVQALEKELGSFAQKQEEFQILVQREVEKETAQIRSILTDILGLKQEEDPVIGAQQLITELRQQCKVKQSNYKGTSSHMSTDKSTSDGNHLFLTSDTEALHCSICMEEWTTAGDHRICSLACGHMFGMSCIRRWLQLHEKNIGTCPQCNKKSKLDDIRILYVPAIPVTERQH